MILESYLDLALKFIINELIAEDISFIIEYPGDILCQTGSRSTTLCPAFMAFLTLVRKSAIGSVILYYN